MDIKKYIVVQIFCLTTASAGQFDVEVGRTYFGPQEDGTWYQQRFEHDLDVEDRFLGFGENGVTCERIPGIYDVSKKHPGSFAFTLRVNI